jgi:hypothetical protein
MDKKYINLNTKLRKNAANDFEKDLFKVMNNSCFEKTMKNVHNRRDIQLIYDEKTCLKRTAKLHTKTFKIINKHTILIDHLQSKDTLDKPMYAGFAILKLSKVLMYDFHYNVIARKYADKAQLLFTDTDSLCYHIRTEDLYDDMADHLDYFDTSNFPQDFK